MKYIFILAMVFLPGAILYGQMTKTVGPGSDYANLRVAFDDINSGTLSGVIVLQITGSYTDDNTATLNASGSGSANYTSITLYPTVSGITLSGSAVSTFIDLNGADNVTIDGRVNQTGTSADLILSNTGSGTHSSVLRFINSAQGNLVRYCHLRSGCSSAGVGMVHFTSSYTGDGNDNNTIEYCTITNAGANRPINAIFSSGSTGRENNGNTIRNNNIYNFLNPDATSFGINLSYLTSNWIIEGNSFYDTETLVPGGSYKYYPVNINTGTHTIRGNYIGGSGPGCSGDPWVIGSNKAHYFCGLFINAGTTPSIVENNTLANLQYSSVEDNPWDGIFINSGNVNVTGNTIGAATGTGSIVLIAPVAAATTTITGGAVTSINLIGGGSAYLTEPVISFSVSGSTSPAVATASISGGQVTGFDLVDGGAGYTLAPNVVFDGQSTGYSTSHGMIQNSTGTVQITNNTIGSITTVGSDHFSHGFESIYVRGVAATLTISGNLIGSLSTANSIQTSSSAHNSLQKQDLFGIYSSGTGTTLISRNTVANLTNAYTGSRSASRTRGIMTINGSNTVSGNTIRDISTANAVTATGSAASVIGISHTGTTVGTIQTIRANEVYALSNTHATAGTAISGIYFSGATAGPHVIAENHVHGLSLQTTSTSGKIHGIALYGGTTTSANNIIHLGSNSAGHELYGIWDESGATNNNALYFNTVYLGGSVTSGITSTTAALFNKNNTSQRDYRNNLLVNARSGGSSGKHLAIRIEGVAGLSIDYNDYFSASGALGRIATLEKADLTAWVSGTGQDEHSLAIDPLFSNAGGATPADYTVSATLPAAGGTGITTDYNEDARSLAPTMGALESTDYEWQGNTSSDFGTASNWTGNEVPPAGATILFAENPANHCVLDQDRTVKNLTNEQGTDRLVLNGKQLTISGLLNLSNGAQVDATGAFSAIVFAGGTAQSIPSGCFVDNTIENLGLNNSHGLVLNGDLLISSSLVLTSGTFSLGANTVTINGSISVISGALLGGSSTNILLGGSGSSTNLPSVACHNLDLDRASGVSLAGNVSVAGTLTLTEGTLTLGPNTLTLAGSSPARVTGGIDASHNSATLVFDNTLANILPPSLFSTAVNNLSITGAGGLSSSGDFTLNGVLDLTGANPSATKGCLDMHDGNDMKTLTMGATAITTGPGDVTGIVKRTSFSPNTEYSFGNPYTSVTFPNTGTLPTEWQVKIQLGSSPSWKTGAVQRVYDIIRSGGSGSLPTVRLHYLDSELNGNQEVDLVFWGNYPSTMEYGKVNSDAGDNWVSLSGSIEFAPTAFGQRAWTLSGREATKNTWNGSSPDDASNWNLGMNWTGGVPGTTDDVLIPAGCAHYPVLPASATINTITIAEGASVDGGSATTLTLNGANDAWNNSGTFIPGSSTVAFSNAAATLAGETDFYHLTINNGAGVTLTTNSISRIAGTLTNEGSLDATAFVNTIDYTGSNQTVVLPNGATPGYHHLVLSGSGTKTMPPTAFTIAGDLHLSGSTSATASSSINARGNVLIEAGATLVSGAFAHTIGGNLENNGTFTTSSGSNITLNGILPQIIHGSATTDFHVLSINNSLGVNILVNETVNNTLYLLNGTLTIGECKLTINGTISKSAGFLGPSPVSSLHFGGTGALELPNNLFSTTAVLDTLSIDRTGGLSLGNQDITVNGHLELTSGTLSLGANSLILAGDSPGRISGSIDASHASASLVFTNASPITLPASLFSEEISNLVINSAGGITSSGDFSVTGNLYLQSENPSANLACLHMWDGSVMKTLSMGPEATTTGPGDVTGIVKRSSFLANTSYSFGNQYTTISFLEGGTYPSELQVKISIGAPPSWKTTAIERVYDFIQTGGVNCIARIRTHYLDTELNGNSEEELVHWTYGSSGQEPSGAYEWGHSNLDPVDNWVEIANVNIAYFPTSFGYLENTLSASENPSYTWNGSQSGSWETIENWTPVGTPSAVSTVTIPDASTIAHTPSLSTSVTINSLSIQPAGVLDLLPGSQLSITTSCIINSYSGLVIHSDASGNASFINQGTISYGSGASARVDQYLSCPTPRNYYFSTPLSSPSYGSAFISSGADHAYTYTESEGYETGWSEIGTGTSLIPGKGYVAHYTTASSCSFTGQLQSADVTLDNLSRTGDNKAGYNLIANPFPSALDWSLLDTNQDISSSIWYRTHDNVSVYSFGTYNGKLGYGTNGGIRYIPPMQSFWIRVKSGSPATLILANAARRHNNHLLFKGEADTKNVFSLMASNSQLKDELIVAFDQQAGEGFEDWDSEKMFSSADGLPQIYTMAGSELLAINSLPVLAGEMSIPLGFRVNAPGTFSLQANLSSFNPNTAVFLHDLSNGIVQDLRDQSCYTFSSPAIDDTSRFLLMFIPVILDGKLTYDNPQKTPLNGCKIRLETLTGEAVDSTLTKADGSFAFSCQRGDSLVLIPLIQAPPGGINATDALQVLRHFAGLTTLTGLKKAAADVNNSGNLNSIDALLIQKYYVGILQGFPSGAWLFERIPFRVSQTGEHLTRDIKGICSGDANGDYIP